jgi:DNA-binding XRE family transcriptional regulator
LEQNPIEQICEDLGVNQKKLAEIIGVSQNTVSTWKKESKTPSWTNRFFNILREKEECLKYKNQIESIVSTNSKYKF